MNEATGLISIMILLAIISVIIVIFLVCREIVCWYWKINTIATLLEEIRNKLSVIAARETEISRSIEVANSGNKE